MSLSCEFRCHKEGNFNWNSQTCNPIFLIRKEPSRCALSEGCLNICSKFTGEHPCRSFISIKLLSNFIEITLWHGCFPVTLFHIFKTSFQCQRVISKKLISKFIEITLRHGCSPVNLLYIFRTLFPKNTYWVGAASLNCLLWGLEVFFLNLCSPPNSTNRKEKAPFEQRVKVRFGKLDKECST